MKVSPIFRLGDFVKPVQDRMVDRTKWNFDKYVAGEHIDSGEIRIRNFGLIKGNEEVIGPAFHMRFKSGHVLYSTRRAYLRKAGIVNFEGICSNVTLVLQANEEKLLQSLLPFILQSEDFVQYAISHSIGSTNPFVKWTDLSKYKIAIPPIRIQKKMSKMLWAVENNVEKIEKCMQVAEKLKRGLLEQLLTKGIGHRKFKKTELGEIPENWEYKKLSEYVIVEKKMIDPQQYPSENFEYYTVPGYDEGEKTLIEKGISIKSSKFIIDNDSILFCKLNPRINRVWLIEHKAGTRKICSTEFIPFVANNNVSIEYLLYMFKSLFISEISTRFQKGTSTSHQRVASSDLLKAKVPVPPISEQKAIVNILNIFVEALKAWESLLRSTKKLKKKLLNSLLSGELLTPKEVMN